MMMEEGISFFRLVERSAWVEFRLQLQVHAASDVCCAIICASFAPKTPRYMG